MVVVRSNIGELDARSCWQSHTAAAEGARNAVAVGEERIAEEEEEEDLLPGPPRWRR